VDDEARFVSGRRPHARWWWFAAAVALGLAGSLAVFAADDRGGAASTSTRELTLPADFTGPVWFELGTPSDLPVHVTIVWGEWTDRFDVIAGQPLTYWTTRSKPGVGAPNPPISVRTSPATSIRFGFDSIPSGSAHVPEQWEPTAPAATTP
jgi:hypothetical protein